MLKVLSFAMSCTREEQFIITKVGFHECCWSPTKDTVDSATFHGNKCSSTECVTREVDELKIIFDEKFVREVVEKV